MQYSDSQLIERFESLASFKGWPDTPVDIWVRSKADAPDKFDDKVYTFDCVGRKPSFAMVCTGTSHAGTFGLLKFRTYNPLGCAVSVPDHITYGSHAYGLHKGKPAYVQRTGILYTRDNNKNLKAENFGKVYDNYIGLNCHRAAKASLIIYNWSIACYVRNLEAQFLEWLKFMDRRILTTVVLSEF